MNLFLRRHKCWQQSDWKVLVIPSEVHEEDGTKEGSNCSLFLFSGKKEFISID